MPISFNHSRVTDGIIRALRYSSVFATDDTAQALRDVDNNMTDAELDALVATLDYGSAGGSGGAGVITSLNDIYAMLDSDGLPGAAHANFFRITRATDVAPITDTSNILMSTYFNSADDGVGSTKRSEVVIGPDTNMLRNDPSTVSTDYEGRLYLGAVRGTASVANAHSMIRGGETVLDGNFPGLQLKSTGGMELRGPGATTFWYDDYNVYNGADPTFYIAPLIPSYMLGGFRRTGTNDSLFNIGPYNGFINTNALLFIGSAAEDWDVVLNTTGGGRVIRFVPRNTNYDMNFEVNAAATGATVETARTLGDNLYPKLIVYGDKIHGGTANAISAIRNVITDYHGSMLLLRNEDWEYIASKSHFIRCQTRDPIFPTLWDDQFTVLNNGDVCARGSITPLGGCDVAEWVVVPDGCDAGEVIIMGTDGVYKKSTEVADAKVVGVIAESPGINLGMDSEVENQHPLAVCGIVATFCTTANGAIVPGDLIVSAPEGKAQKADPSPATGTVLGKALAALDQPGEDPVSGLVKMLAMLQ